MMWKTVNRVNNSTDKNVSYGGRIKQGKNSCDMILKWFTVFKHINHFYEDSEITSKSKFHVVRINKCYMVNVSVNGNLYISI
jgi:hypothetical protein